MSYQVRVTVDNQQVMEKEITQTGRIESINLNYTFKTLGPHTVKATLHPATHKCKKSGLFREQQPVYEMRIRNPKAQGTFCYE